MNTIKNITKIIFFRVQKFLLTLGLFLLYTIGFGLTFLFVFLFRRSILKENFKNSGTFWEEANHYTESMEEAGRQS